MEHPFDRYAAFTDLDALRKFSDMQLRKSIRVNTLKTNVEKVKDYATKKSWTLTPVPWCSEGFFIDRPVNADGEREALGKDLLQLLGHFYIQESASMLPPALLGALPGETILDMSAAPGSKTTQLAATMQGSGCIVANDVQEKRLWTLKSGLHRLGAHNAIVTKKVGQWFSKQMTVRFDRVLCDAPCTAQGTARKDSDALDYCSLENIGKMARLQYQLLESAINACKVGGTIVYSTCTLTPEENEGVVMQMLERYKGQIETVDPRTMPSMQGWSDMSRAIDDSIRVQESIKDNFQFTILNFPFLRLWPQTYDTEGFFSAVIRKVAPTKQPMEWEAERFQEEELSRNRKEIIMSTMNKLYGGPLFKDTDRLFQMGERVILTNEDVARFRMPIQDYALGMPCCKRLQDERLVIDHDFATLRGDIATKQVIDCTPEQVELLLDAKDAECEKTLHGHVLLRTDGMTFGVGLAKEGKLKNNLPRWMVRF